MGILVAVESYNFNIFTSWACWGTEQNGQQFADAIFKLIFSNGNHSILIEISCRFVLISLNFLCKICQHSECGMCKNIIYELNGRSELKKKKRSLKLASLTESVVRLTELDAWWHSALLCWESVSHMWNPSQRVNSAELWWFLSC